MTQPPPPPSQPPGPPPSGASPGEPEGPQSGATPESQKPDLAKPDQAADGPGQQPPQPPGQPPQPGGFGAPPQPPGGGYGYPQQQPGGGYGYPQQQPQQGGPVPPGAGYGFPQQPPPGGYGFPQQPGQPPYGPGGPGMHPTMPPGGYGPGGPGAPGGGNGNGKVIAIVAAAVAAVVVIATVGYFLVNQDDKGKEARKGGGSGTSQGGGKPKSTEGKELFKIKSPAIDGDRAVRVGGAWAKGDIFAKTTLNGVIGMDAAKGQESWKLELDGEVCAATRSASEDGKVALLHRKSKAERADCNQLTVFDIDDGQKDWQEQLPDDSLSTGTNLAISQGVVAVKWIGGSIAYKLSSGTKVWAAPENARCEDEGFVGGKELMAVVRCGSYSKPQLQLQKVNPETGKLKWQFDLPKGVQRARVVSTDPIVAVVSAGTSTPTDVMTVGDDQKLKAKISLGDRKYEPGCNVEVDSCASVLADKDYVYMPTGTHQGESSSTNELLAFDINTGKPKWKVDAGEERTLTPVRLLDGKVIAYKKPTYSGRGGQVVAIDPKQNGKSELYLENPGVSSRTENNFASIIQREPPLYENGRLFLHQSLLSASSVKSYGAYLGMAFGPE